MLSPDTFLQNRYRVIRRVGQGGMGAVYEARHEELGQTVALKETFHTDDEAMRQAFKREARMLAGLQHPGLPRVTDYFAEGTGQFLVMEFVPGKDLYGLLTERGAPFSSGEVARWAEQLLDVLEYLHTQTPPVIHRDLKPNNIKLNRRGNIVLLDFGLAKGAIEQSNSIIVSHSVVGYTPNYAPLEQVLKADPNLIEQLSVFNSASVNHALAAGTDARSDLYALGATIYHLATGRQPPQSSTRALAVWSGREDPLLPAHALNGQIPAAFSNVLGKAMGLNAATRFNNAAEMRRAVLLSVEADSEMEIADTLLGANQPAPTQLAEKNPARHTVRAVPPVTQPLPAGTQFSPNAHAPATIQPAPPALPILNSEKHQPKRSVGVLVAGVLGILSVFVVAAAIVGWAVWASYRSAAPTAIVDNQNPKQPTVGGRERAVALTAEAEKLMQSAKYDEAIAKSREAIETDANYPLAHTIYGDCIWDTEDDTWDVSELSEVQKSADKIIELLPNPATGEEFTARSWAYSAKSKHTDALADAEKAVALAPTALAYTRRAATYLSIPKQQYKKALADYDEVLRLNPNYAQGYLNRASGHWGQRKYKEAISDMTEAIRLHPTAFYYTIRGEIYQSQNKLDAAGKEYEEALRLSPNFRRAVTDTANLLRVRGKNRESIEAYNRVFPIKDGDHLAANAYAGRGVSYYNLKNFEQAIADFTRAIELDSENAGYYESRAILYRAAKKPALAKADDAEAKRLKK